MKTYMAKGETVERSWYVVDAEDMVLGRLSSQVAAIYYQDKFQRDIAPEMLDMLEEAVKRVRSQEEE